MGFEVVEPVDDRSPMAQALAQGSQVTAISLMMVIPAIIGHFIDQRLGTLILFTGIGFVVGVAAAVFQLVQLVRYQNRRDDLQRENARKNQSDSDQVDSDQ